MTLHDTPRGERIHIGFFGQCNSGKSSLLNTLCKQQVSIVSDVKGTTTDVVVKAMELPGIGACTLLDTAGFNDDTELGTLRLEKTKEALKRCDIAVVLIQDESDILQWQQLLTIKKVDCIYVHNKSDISSCPSLENKVNELFHEQLLSISSVSGLNMDVLLRQLREKAEKIEEKSLLGHLVKQGDVVLLVMPQDVQAPKGRLILPQVQTIRDALDHHCIVVSTTLITIEQSLNALSTEPDWIICDSSIFKEVYPFKPKNSKITSFSILMADYKGDLQTYLEGIQSISKLNRNSTILIAECCSHKPVAEDIGRVKIPTLLKKRFGESIVIEVMGGQDFPDDCSKYDLIIQCGACMFNRSYVMERLNKAKHQEVPITNYGIFLAYMANILDDISYK